MQIEKDSLEALRNVPLEAWTRPDILQLIDAIEKYGIFIDQLIKEKRAKS
jgi:hypothetical protein